jgi:hypothetical protein
MLLLLQEHDGTGISLREANALCHPRHDGDTEVPSGDQRLWLALKPFEGACAARVSRRTPDRASEIIRIEQQGHCLLGREFSVNNANAIGVVTPILHPLALTEF